MDIQATLQNLKLSEAKVLLSWLKWYKDMVWKLWIRGRSLFHQKLSASHNLELEYFPALSEDHVVSQAQDVYKKSFGLEVKKDEIHLRKNDDIKGGIKVYCDDSMVDLSFKKVEKLLQK